MEKSSDYGDMKYILQRPCSLFPPADSLTVVLALIDGVARERFPPHGSGFLPGFGEFVRRRFHAPPTNHNVILIEQFGHLPLREGCDAVLNLLEEWKAIEGIEGVQQ